MQVGLQASASLRPAGPMQPMTGVGEGPCAHPLPPCSGLVRGQTEDSMEEVHPRHCAEYLVEKHEECRHVCCKNPEFSSIPAEVGQWRDGIGAVGVLAPFSTPLVGVHSPGCSSPLLSSILQSWKWVLAPVILYIFERILRVWRARQKVLITKVGGAGAREGGDGAAALAGVAARR